jgi:hypothetical protein
MKMKSKMTKFLNLVLAIVALASAISFAVPAAAVPGDARDLRGGCWTERHRWIEFGEYNGKPLIWRILEVSESDGGSPAAFLLAENAVAEMPFNSNSSNDWLGSDIKRWLNEDFYNAAFSEKERDAIINSTYRYGGKYEGSDKTAASKVFLLSTDEARNERFFANDDDRITNFENELDCWWLRSPGDDDYSAADVYIGVGVYTSIGVYDSGESVDLVLSVRPALKVNLSSSIFTSSSSKYEILYPVTVKVRGAYRQPIRGAAVAADNPRQKYFTGDDGEVLMKLGAGQQKIRVSVAGREVMEITPDVRPGGLGVAVDIPAAFTYEISFPASTAALSNDAGNLRGGAWTEEHRWITFGEYDGEPIIWRVLEAGETDDAFPAAFLLAEDAVAEMPFDDFSYDWNNSDINRWLNEDFYRGAFSEKERETIMNSSYRYGGEYGSSKKEAVSKVFLLSTDEAEDESFFANDADRSIEDWWWLRSPGSNDVFAALVYSDGEVFGGGYFVMHGRAVRPALKINLASSIFTSLSSEYEILYPVTVKVRGTDTRPIRGAAVAADSPRQKYFTGTDGTVEMKLSAGNQKIRVSAAGRGVKEFTLNVKPGGGSIEVDM